MSDSLPSRPAFHTGPFAPIPSGARITPLWGVVLLCLGFFGLAAAVSLLGAAPFLLAALIGEGGMTAMLQSWMLVAVILLNFAAFAAAAMLWTRIYERRGLATIGFRRGLWRYGRGALAGLALAALLLGIGLLLGQEEAAPILSGYALMMSPEGALFLLLFVLVFAVQAGAEEVVVRGWMLSAIAARRGPVAGALLSSAIFAALHLHYAAVAPLTGLLVLLGVALIGVVLAFYAMTERSLWGVCGLHAAYNYVLMSAGAAAALSAEPDAHPMEIATDAFMDITSVTEYDPSLPVLIAVLGALSAAAWAVWRRSQRRSGAAA